MEPTTLQITWFILLFVLLIGYAILDGFDLGVGMLHLTGKTDDERRLGLQAIGPVWDGNEVWLITGGGALFAAFPFVYATVFSAMYLPLLLVLLALIGRAVAIEFRSKEDSRTWRSTWDVIFFLGSALPSLLFGVAFGNILRGLPIDHVNGQLQFTGGFFGLLNPFSVVCGVLSVLLFLQHGAIYLAMKSDGPQQERSRRLAMIFYLLGVVVYIALTIAAMVSYDHLFRDSFGRPLFWVFLLIVIAGVLSLPILLYSRHFGRAMIASSAMIAGMMALAAQSLFPRLVPSTVALSRSLTIMNSSSTQYTLGIMLAVALVGMPIVLIYTFVIYRVFKGKTIVHPQGY